MDSSVNLVLAVVGPTAIGKSGLALRLAQDFNGEIVSADSRQVYRHMDIGTAKPGLGEMALVPHHVVDIINPEDDFSLAQYRQLAYQAITGIHQRGRLALLVGGSGLYVWSVLEGWEISPVPPDQEYRRNLEQRASRGEGDELYRELLQVDPEAAQSIDRKNVRRVIRALEVYQHAGAPFSRLYRKQAPPFDVLVIGLTADRAEVYRRADLRVDRMIEQGLVDEVKRLVGMGYGFDLPAMSGIGYRQIGAFLRGETALDAAIRQIKFDTHRFIRSQYNWFRLKDRRIKWFDVTRDEVEAEIRGLVAGFIAR